jgi:FixJ family two-component response regulator
MALVVDDDPSVFRSLNRLLSGSGFHVKTFGSAPELLASETPKSNACMVVDIDLPEITGIEMCEVFEGSVTWPTHHISHRPNGRQDSGTGHAIGCGRGPVQTLRRTTAA